ncbi:tetratricopeptide repeat protein [Litorilinea aerophila]|uniref:Tetratricopeptide repeat protein n=1 Tax=Litorilinea aerophila TaxID=1204385 RepID=A0A540VFA5_9CHLR|nr:tetratricopeptide repeat protein [Litorilinea aerophila]MCC9076956.1 tetratricopeptide repeat protein [Litorilinea aerophila]
MADSLNDTSKSYHNLGLYRLTGFSGRRAQLRQLHEWMIGGDDLPAIAISGERGMGKSTLATAAAWSFARVFSDGIVRVGAAGAHRFRLYDIVRTMDTVFGTTLTRISEERWGISILEQLYRRRRLLILDELSGALPEELNTLVDIIGHLHEAGGHSRVLFIDRDFSPAIAELVQFQHIHLEGLILDELPQLIQARAPEPVREEALAHVEELWHLTTGQPFMLRLIWGLMLDFSWEELGFIFQDMADPEGVLHTEAVAAFAVENFAAIQPQAGPLLDRLVSAAGGASLAALGELFWADLGTPAELQQTLHALTERALLDLDPYEQRVVMHPVVRSYMEQNAVMLGEDWERRHARYYVALAERYQYLPLERWPEVDVEWGNIYKGADWCAARMQRLWQDEPIHFITDPVVDQEGIQLPPEVQAVKDDLRLARAYALALAHYAFWRHPPGIQRWLAAGALASLALTDLRDYAWIQLNLGRQLFFTGQVEQAVHWLSRAAAIFDSRDLLTELAYTYTDLGTSNRILDNPRQALRYFRAAFDCVAQLGDQYGLATAYMNLGSAYYGLDDYEHALREYRKALRIALRLGYEQQAASAFNSMGLALEGMDRLAEAQQAYQNALQIFRRIRDLIGISTCYNNLGSVAYAQGDYQQALHWYELDLALSEQRGAWTDMAATLHNLGHVALELGRPEQALEYFQQSRELYAAFELTDYVQEEEEMIEYIQSLEGQRMA